MSVHYGIITDHSTQLTHNTNDLEVGDHLRTLFPPSGSDVLDREIEQAIARIETGETRYGDLEFLNIEIDWS